MWENTGKTIPNTDSFTSADFGFPGEETYFIAVRIYGTK